jgi:hypothetical protein
LPERREIVTVSSAVRLVPVWGNRWGKGKEEYGHQLFHSGNPVKFQHLTL